RHGKGRNPERSRRAQDERHVASDRRLRPCLVACPDPGVEDGPMPRQDLSFRERGNSRSARILTRILEDGTPPGSPSQIETEAERIAAAAQVPGHAKARSGRESG